ncbi:MAG: DUF924 domain-containing protein [Alphaproteobacteria bacterium]|nr:DUF924 domain-containing protein [Alphaproteobacteria bacterium]
MTTPSEVLTFWFGSATLDAPVEPQERWFKKDPAFDQLIRERFAAMVEVAERGGLDAWLANPEGCLALLILLDQFPRNMFRDTAKMYSCDEKARTVAVHAVARGFDRRPAPVARWFMYLPFVHSEALIDQERALALFDTIPDGEVHTEARRSLRRHHEIIVRFGRFPHRNHILGRASTPQESEFLKEPNSSF